MINFFSVIPCLVKQKASVEPKKAAEATNGDEKSNELDEQKLAESLLNPETESSMSDEAVTAESFKLFALKKGLYTTYAQYTLKCLVKL